MSYSDRDLRERDPENAKKAAGTVLAIGKAGREARLNADYSNASIISTRAYNAILTGTVLWGILLSAILCTLVGNVYEVINPLLFIILYLALAIGGCVLANKSHKPALSFLGFNMVAVPFGLLISTVVSQYLEVDPSIVYYAILDTGLITLGMFGLAMAFPGFVSKLSGMLLVCLGGMIFCELILLVFGVDQGITDWIGAGLFSLYIAYDIYRSQQFEKTTDNAIDCALDIYMDIANLFLRILSIIAKAKSKD